MILFKTPWLKLVRISTSLGDFYDFKHKKWILCPETIREYFDLPEDVQKINFVAYSHPGRDRVKLEFNLASPCEVEVEGCTQIFYEIFADGEEVGFNVKAQEVIEKLLRKHSKIYVECLYED